MSDETKVTVVEDTESVICKRFEFGKFVIVCKNLTLDRFEHKLCNEKIKQLGRQQYEIRKWLVRNVRPANKESVFTLQEYEEAIEQFHNHLFKRYTL